MPGHELIGKEEKKYINDIFEQDLFNKYTKLWYENNLDDTTKSDEEINNEALRLLKYKVLGFNLTNGSKEKK